MSSPTSSFTSRSAPSRLLSPFTAEPPTHSHRSGYEGLFAARWEMRYCPLEFDYAKNHTGLPDVPDYQQINEFKMYVNERIVKGEI